MKKVSALQLGVKVYLSVLIAAILGCVVSFLVIASTLSPVAAVVLQFFNFFILVSMVYSTAWKDGYAEMNRVKCGYSEYQPWKGLIAGLIGMIPCVLLWCVLLLCKALNLDYVVYYRLLNFHYVIYINHFLDPDLLITELEWIDFLGVGAYWLTVPVVSGISYLVGYRRYSIMEFLFYKKKTNR